MPLPLFPEAVTDLIDAEEPWTVTPPAFPSAIVDWIDAELPTTRDARTPGVAVRGHRLDRGQVADDKDALTVSGGDRRLDLAQFPRTMMPRLAFAETTMFWTVSLSAMVTLVAAMMHSLKLRRTPFLIVTLSKPPLSSIP